MATLELEDWTPGQLKGKTLIENDCYAEVTGGGCVWTFGT